MALDFSASEPNLGYIYQSRYGLMLIMQQENECSKLLIEQLDDVSIDTNGNLNLNQTKFHIKSAANLTNSSTDFWKTIRVWSEGIKEKIFEVDICVFNLITTAVAPKDTIPFLLKHETLLDRDVPSIQTKMIDVAKKSKNKVNHEAYKSFLSLSSEQQQNLLKRISVIDASSDIEIIKEKILHELRHYAKKKDSLFERLEGWYLNEIILQLTGKRNGITAKEVSNKILDISEQLKDDNLPNDFNLSITDDQKILSEHNQQKFVEQLGIIKANQKLINIAISDYYRAFNQKSKWIREGLIMPGDEIFYDTQLIENWERKFAIQSDFETESDPEILANSGLSFYTSHYVKTFPQLYIKQRFTEQYMVTGSCHMLSDKKKIGWHPKFNSLI